MTAYRHPDASIAAWLADGPETLSLAARTSVKAAVHTTRQRSVVVLPMPMLRRASPWRVLLAAALALSLVAGLALVAGVVPDLTPEPSATRLPTATPDQSPTATHAPPSNPPAGGPAQPIIHGAGRTIALEWTFPDGLTYDHGAVFPIFGGEGQQGYYFTLDGRGQYGDLPSTPAATDSDAARGIVIADVFGATVPYNDGVVLGDIDAGTFMSRLGASQQFDVGAVTPASVGDLVGLEADVSGTTLERIPKIDLSLPSHLIALNVSGGILAVQIWAGSPGGLAAWLPEAMSLLESLRFVEPGIFDCWPDARPVQVDPIDRAGSFALEGTRITVEYTLPPGGDFVAGSGPGVVGFEEPAFEEATGLSYGYGAPLSGSPRGLLVGEATFVKGHGMAGEIFPSGADGFVDGLDAVRGVRLENVRDGRGPDGLVSRTAVVRLEPGPALWTHIDRGAGVEIGCLLDFTRPSRVSVVMVGTHRLVFQAWAAGDAELARWLPIAQTFTESMHIEVAP